MKCSKCGRELPAGSYICPNCDVIQGEPKQYCLKCGNEIIPGEMYCRGCGTLTEAAIQKQKSEEKQKKIAHRKKVLKIVLIPTVILVIIASLGYGGYQYYLSKQDFTKISWDKNFGDYEVNYTTIPVLQLRATVLDKDNKPLEVTYTVDKGEVEEAKDYIIWRLPEEEGTYEIKAQSPSGKSVTKKVNVVHIDDDTDSFVLAPSTNPSDSGDEDKDGLTNAKEKELRTNPFLADTDQDGLLDAYEVQLKTDPLTKDTDGDGLYDGAEVTLKTNPLKEVSNKDGKKDGERTYTTTITKGRSDEKLTITGVGNVPLSGIDVYDNHTLSTKEGFLGKVYRISSESKSVSKVTATILYTDYDLKKANIGIDNVQVYYLDIEAKELVPVDTKVQKKNLTITFSHTQLGNYVIGDRTKVSTTFNTHILFAIDDSISMYSEAQIKEMGYDTITGASGNDTEFKRISLSKELVNSFNGNNQYAVAEFSGDLHFYTDFTADKAAVIKALDSIHDMENNSEGTAIVDALNKGIAAFDESDSDNYLILLTDGVNTKNNLKNSSDKIITAAKEKDVKICIVGLGEVDKDALKKIAEGTGCGFYYAKTAGALDEAYTQLSEDINYGLINIATKTTERGILSYDSEFLPSKNGFPFQNYTTVNANGINSYGMSVVANYFYRKVLPSSLEAYTAKQLFGVTGTYTSEGYIIPKKGFLSNRDNELYDYQLSYLSVIFGYKNIADYWDRVENDTLKIKEEYRNSIEKAGGKIITKNQKSQKLNYTKIEIPLIDISSSSLNAAEEDVILFRAIFRNTIEQGNNEVYSFAKNPTKAWEYLYQYMERKDPVVLTFTMKDTKGDVVSAHAVNVIRIFVDKNDGNTFYFEVYDSNYPGTSKYLTVKRNRMNKINTSKFSWNDEYQYKFSYGEYGYEIANVELAKLDY